MGLAGQGEVLTFICIIQNLYESNIEKLTVQMIEIDNHTERCCSTKYNIDKQTYLHKLKHTHTNVQADTRGTYTCTNAHKHTHTHAHTNLKKYPSAATLVFPIFMPAIPSLDISVANAIPNILALPWAQNIPCITLHHCISIALQLVHR